MSITATAKGGGTFQIAPAGTHIGRCVQIIDLGTQKTNFQGREKRARKVRIAWELPEELATFNADKGEEPFVVGKEYTLSLGDKATLRKDLEAWRGRAFTNEELEGFDLAKLLGVPCLLTIVHEVAKSSGNNYAKIVSVTKIGKNMTCPPQISAGLEYSIDQGKNEIFQSLPEWLQDKCKQCEEWNAPAREAAADAPEHTSHPEEDDVPF